MQDKDSFSILEVGVVMEHLAGRIMLLMILVCSGKFHQLWTLQ